MVPEAASPDREQQRRHWRLAAILFIGGGVGAIPSDALQRPAHEPTIYLLPALAIASGLVCWAIADRASIRWLHLMVVVATLEIALTVWLAADLFAIYYTLIAIFAAYVFTSRRAIAAHVALACLCVLAPIVYDPETARETLARAMALIPVLVLAAVSVAWLRERLQASEDRYRRLAERDPLTGVGNYRMLTERLPVELERSRRHRQRLSLLMIDMNDFKRVNDEHGHQYGDGVLRDVAESLERAVRGHDLVVRQGGDEFAVVAPQTDRAEADQLVARLCEAVSEIEVKGRSLGACIGCAVFPDDADNVDELLAHADDELRARKDANPELARSVAARRRSAALGV